jgi:phytoene dehydrogenase-like protein
MRLSFSYRAEELQRELRRELDWPAERTEQFGRVLSGTDLNRGTFASAIAKMQLPVEYEAYGPLQTALYGSMVPASIPFPTYKKLIGLAARSVRYPLGGQSALKERLISRLQVFGGTMKRNTRVEEIVFERGRLTGVLLSSYEGFIRSPRVAGALDAETFYRLLPAGRRPKRLADAMGNISPRFWRLSFTIVLPEPALPEGMGSHLALINPAQGMEQENFLQLQVFRKDSYGGIPAGQVALVARALVPFEEETIRPHFIERVLKRSLRQIEGVMPFLREAAFSVSPDPEKLAEDAVFQRYYSFASLEDVPTMFRVYESSWAGGPDSPGQMDWSEYGLAGLSLCARDIRPYEGFVGEIATAMDILGRLKGETRKRDKQ